LAQGEPRPCLAGTAGVGAASHVAGILFQRKTNTRFQFVPYRGAAPALQDLVAGQIDMMIDTPANSLPQVRAGQIKCFAVTAKSRLASAPEIPTLKKPGFLATLPQCGSPFSRRKVLRGKSPQRSMPQCSVRLPNRQFAHGPTWVCKFLTVISNRQRLCALSKKLKSRSGGRSLRQRTSEVNETLERKVICPGRFGG
jgi:hypothetical protein